VIGITMHHFEKTSIYLRTRSNASWLCFFLYVLLLAIFSGVALGKVRGLQLAAFYVPISFLCTLHLPLTIKRILLICNITFCFLIVSFCGIQGFLYKNYDASLDSSFVIQALANTNTDEAVSYLKAGLEELLLWGTSSLLVFILCTICLTKIIQISSLRSKSIFALTCVLSAIFLFSFYQDAWRKRFPLFVYTDLLNAVEAQKDYWKEIKNENKGYLLSAKNLISHVAEGPKTIVLVIGESTSREDMSLYGYTRNTTPRLKEIEAKDELFGKAQEAYSTKFSTVPAFNSMLEFDIKAPKKEHVHLLALFKEAGYHITWISNQDDLGIEAEYASFADKMVQMNRQRGRSSASFDEKVIPELKRALSKNYEKKLIIVHLIGLHPHFALRFPEGTKATWSKEDDVAKSLKEMGRSRRTLILKEQYNLGMLYQDKIISESLDLTKKAAGSAPVDWIYLSDHGAESGHRGDFVGHSSKTLGGYTIPFLFWSNEKTYSQERNLLSNRPFRADWLSFLLLDLAGIKCSFPTDNKSWLNSAYRWKEPDVITSLKSSSSDSN
ncbi:phosphoethanolamine transferase, partial [uncultured Parasutterella sp.]|uniref:phosphoethanolamine transferase n=2 Tax=uncultured Parasutterella sp. TaxID=1263098 RepID=UPI0026745E8A